MNIIHRLKSLFGGKENGGMEDITEYRLSESAVSAEMQSVTKVWWDVFRGARPSHAVYQGRQYTQKEYEQKIRGLLNDYGCRHDVYPVILGVSEPVYTEQELQNIDPPPFTYEGRRYTAYEAQQQMRKMERAMRKQKNRCIVADASGDDEAFTTASIKLRRQKDIYEDFCKAADSYTQYERTFVGGYDRHLSGRTGAVTRRQRAFENAQLRLTDSGDSGIIGAEIANGNIKLEINAEKQERHIQGSSRYVDGRSYITISEKEAQNIINAKSGTGTLVKDRKGNWKHKELIDCGKKIGVDIGPVSHKETPTDKATIHYSKAGTHLVPRKEKNND